MTPENIIIHQTLTKDDMTVSWVDIRRFHTSYRYDGNIVSKATADQLIADGEHVTPPWSDIGYHAGIELIEGDYEILMGRMWNVSGAHCVQDGMNHKSLGLALVGNFDKEPPPNDQLHLAMRLVSYWMKLFGISKERVFRHSDFASYKTCPGKQFPWSFFINGLNDV